VTGGGSSIPEVQRLLRVLATGRKVAEAGTAFGEGAAAMAETAVSLVTVELDPIRAETARERLSRYPNVELLVGDWRELLPQRAPFELVFLDGGGYKQRPDEFGPAAFELLAPSGLLVIDDLTPGLRVHDPARAWLSDHPRLAAVEILTTPTSAAMIAARTML
jgi:predicted O-methyltransferase YrrM